MRHTVVGKVVPLHLEALGSNPSGVDLQDCRQDQAHHGKIFGFFWFIPLLFFGDPRECRGNVAFPPTCGPPRRQGLGIQF